MTKTERVDTHTPLSRCVAATVDSQLLAREREREREREGGEREGQWSVDTPNQNDRTATNAMMEDGSAHGG